MEIKAKTTRNPSPAATYILEGFEKSGGITGEGDGHIQCSFCKNFVEAGFQVPEILVKGVEAAIITHVAFYAGWLKGWAVFNLAKEVWDVNE